MKSRMRTGKEKKLAIGKNELNFPILDSEKQKNFGSAIFVKSFKFQRSLNRMKVLI